MHAAVVCTVGLLVAVGGTAQHLNVQLRGFEIRDLSSDRSLVDFTADIRRKRLQVVGPTTIPINTNMCLYDANEVDRFNSTNSEMTALELQTFAKFSTRTVGQISGHKAAKKFLRKTIKHRP